MLPSLPSTSRKAQEGTVEDDYELMPTIKRVMDYSRLNYFEVLDLPFDTFQLMFKHSYIDSLRETEEGRKYLEKCERLKKTSPDIEALKKRM